MSEPDRYFAKPRELAILIPQVKSYFSYPKRSEERKKICVEILKKLDGISDHKWTPKTVRVWFRNNKPNYIGLNIKDLPSIILQHIPPEDRQSDDDLPSNTNETEKVDPVQQQNSSTNPPVNFELFSRTFSTEASSLATAPDYTLENLIDDKSENTVSKINMLEKPPSEPTSDITIPCLDDIVLPEIPTFSENESFDECKFKSYEYIHSLNKAIGKTKKQTPEIRNRIIKEIENLMTEILAQILQLHIKPIFSLDKTVKILKSFKSAESQRQVSSTTARYANDRLACGIADEFSEISPGVFHPLRAVKGIMPRPNQSPNLFYLLHGECSIESRPLNCEIQCCSISETGHVAYTYLNTDKRCHVLHYLDNEVPTGFFDKTTSMYFDESNNLIYVAGDCRAKSFDATNLNLVATYSLDNSRSMKVTDLTLYNDEKGSHLVMGTKGIIAAWKINDPNSSLKSRCSTELNEQSARSCNLDFDLIDWNRGNKPEWTFTPEFRIEYVSSVCNVGRYIAFASRRHHSIHLLDKETLQVTGRLVGHIGGITSLIAYGPDVLLSTSKDMTMRIWNLELTITSCHIFRHLASVTTATITKYENNDILFSAGKDFTVRAWNLSKNCAAFEIRYDPSNRNLIPIKMKFVPEQTKLIVVNRDSVIEYTFRRETDHE